MRTIPSTERPECHVTVFFFFRPLNDAGSSGEERRFYFFFPFFFFYFAVPRDAIDARAHPLAISAARLGDPVRGGRHEFAPNRIADRMSRATEASRRSGRQRPERSRNAPRMRAGDIRLRRLRYVASLRAAPYTASARVGRRFHRSASFVSVSSLPLSLRPSPLPPPQREARTPRRFTDPANDAPAKQ